MKSIDWYTKNIQFRFENVTVTKAEQYLEHNVSNRRIRRFNVSRFVNLNNAGQIKTIPVGISFDVNGRLIDGQHRLKALIESGIPMLLLISTGWPTDVYEALDCGSNRTRADRTKLYSDDEKKNSRIVGITDHIGKFDRVAEGKSSQIVFSPTQIKKIFKKYEEDIDLVESYINNAETKYPFFSNKKITAILVRYHKYALKKESEEFIKVLYTGFTTKKHYSPNVLRNRLIKRKELNYTEHDCVRAVFSHINLFHAGKLTKRNQFSDIPYFDNIDLDI